MKTGTAVALAGALLAVGVVAVVVLRKPAAPAGTVTAAPAVVAQPVATPAAPKASTTDKVLGLVGTGLALYGSGRESGLW